MIHQCPLAKKVKIGQASIPEICEQANLGQTERVALAFGKLARKQLQMGTTSTLQGSRLSSLNNT